MADEQRESRTGTTDENVPRRTGEGTTGTETGRGQRGLVGAETEKQRDAASKAGETSRESRRQEIEENI